MFVLLSQSIFVSSSHKIGLLAVGGVTLVNGCTYIPVGLLGVGYVVENARKRNSQNIFILISRSAHTNYIN